MKKPPGWAGQASNVLFSNAMPARKALKQAAAEIPPLKSQDPVRNLAFANRLEW
jgi:hypothetical protein